MHNRNLTLVGNRHQGFTIIEAVIAITFITLVGVVIVVFQKSVIGNTKIIQSNLVAQTQIRKTLQMFVAEVRSSTQSAAGGYVIEKAATSSLVFYGNIDNDSLIERVRYFIPTTTPPTALKKGITKPTGTAYNLSGEKVSDLVTGIKASSTVPIFVYFDASYNGTSSSTPLAQPVNIADIRLVKIALPVDPNASRSPVFQTYSTQAMFRNLKDNYNATSSSVYLSTVDATAPSIPTGLSATAISPTQINLSWTASTDNVAVTGYKIFRNSVQVGTAAGTSYSDTGLTPSTAYTYTVSAYDAAGNGSAQSVSAGATTQAIPDTTAPSIPTGLSATAISPTQINLSWTASTDNVAVTGYKIFRNSVQVGTAAGTSYSDTGLTPSTAYTYTVSAYDAAGNNSSQSSSANATTPSGLVGHWAFNEGSGITAADSSGNGNTGTVSGATWTTGRIGGGLDFSVSGTADYVILPSTVLSGKTNITTAFWLKTSSVESQAIISGAKAGVDNEYLIFFGSKTSISLYNGANIAAFNIPSIADNSWHHYAVVRDDTNNQANLYVDGAADNENPKAVTLSTLTVDAGGLVVGQEQDSVGGGFDAAQDMGSVFDDLRIYNRVLTLSEIQALANP